MASRELFSVVLVPIQSSALVVSIILMGLRTHGYTGYHVPQPGRHFGEWQSISSINTELNDVVIF